MFNFGDEGFGSEDHPPMVRHQPVLPYAKAMEASFSSSTWSGLKLSTTPAVAMTRLMYRGFYRQELIQLVLLGERGHATMDELTKRRDKGASLETLEKEYKVDGAELARDAEAKRAEVDGKLGPIDVHQMLNAAISTTPLSISTSTAYPRRLRDAPNDIAMATTTIVTAGGARIRTEVARTPEEEERGLMYRTGLEPDYGMLFVFDQERVLPFWMKNTWVDLDIVYLDGAGRITKVFVKVPHSSADTPDEKVARIHAWGKYVLELPAGAAKRYKLKKGQVMAFTL